MLLLEDRLRKETANERDRLRHLEDERIPNLGRNENLSDSQLQEAIDQEEQQSREKEDLQAALDRKSHQKQRLAELKQKLEGDTNALIDSMTAIDGELRKLRAKRSELEEERNRHHEDLQSAVSEKQELQEVLWNRCLQVTDSYFAELREWILQQSRKSQQQQKELQVVQAFERARMTEPEVMDLWESHQELTRFINEASVGATRERLLPLREEVEAELEVRFPGALSARMSEQPLDAEGYLYAMPDNESKMWIILPIRKEDAESLGATWKDADAESLLRTAWAIARHWNAGTQDTTLRFSSTGWLMLGIDAQSQPDDEASVSLALPGGRSIALHIRNAPADSQGGFDAVVSPDDTTTLDLSHPLCTVVYMANLTDFESLWPTPEEGIAETLARLRSQAQQPRRKSKESGKANATVQKQLGLSDHEVHALFELVGKGRWGKTGVPEEAFKRYLGDAQDPMGSIRTLTKKGLILKRKGRTYSLNPASRDSILLLKDEVEGGPKPTS